RIRWGRSGRNTHFQQGLTMVLPRRLLHVVCLCVLSICVLALLPAPAEAQRGPRLSEELRQRLQTGDAQDVRVIVTATQAEVNRIARQHNARVAKRTLTGAVLELGPGALATMALDERIDALSE